MGHQHEHEHFVSKNADYVSTFGEGGLALPPARHLVVVTCMDARIEPARQLGINLGDAHIIRNAGGSPQEAIRSIVISQRLLGTKEIAVFRHTGCGMLTFTTPQLQQIVRDAAPGDSSIASAVNKIDFLEFSNLEEAVKSDVEFLKSHPLVLKETTITGWIYDVETGKATRIA